VGINVTYLRAFPAVALREILLAIRPYYARITAWWDSREVLRKRLDALRVVAQRISRNMQRQLADAVSTVLTAQVQSRDELATMSPAEIMAAWRDGRLKWLMRDGNSHAASKDYYDKTFHNWVSDGGRRRP
jgi:hypothetical protein